MFIKKFVNHIRKKNEEMKTDKLTLLVNCSYSFLNVEDEQKKTSIWENRYTGKRIRYYENDGTYEPIATI